MEVRSGYFSRKHRRASKRNAKKAHRANTGYYANTLKQRLAAAKNLKLAQTAAKKVKAWKTANRASMKGDSLKRGRKTYKLNLVRRSDEARCEICDTPCFPRKDHCHKTGRKRGKLCNNCNLGLGLFKDKPYILRKAARYLEGYAGVQRFPRLREIA